MKAPVMENGISRRRAWISWILTGFAVAFLLVDAGMKLLALPVVLEAGAGLGFTGAAMARGLGLLLLGCTILHLIPRTTFAGVALLTGYLGGAIATQLRVGAPLFTHILFGLYIALLLWGGLYLRNARLRALF